MLSGVTVRAGKTKTIEEHFRDWESNTFGYGYGTGEPHTIPAVRRFLELCDEGDLKRAYDYRRLEAELTPTVAWLLINAMAKADVTEYGGSPRFAWLTPEGERLRAFMLSKTDAELIEIADGWDREEYGHCSPSACNCGPNGYEKGRRCGNPFWVER